MLGNIYRPQLADFISDRALKIQTFLLGVLITLLYRPFAQAETGDPSIWDYIAQSVLRGQVPYRDVIEIKSPLSAYFSALAMLAGRLFGVEDVLAVRALYVLLVGVIVLLTFIVAREYLNNKIAGIIAVLTLLMSDHFVRWMISGTEPKLLMMIFGLLTLIFTARNFPFAAGIFSMLACLCWQPGLLFTGTAFLVFSNYLTRWRDGRAVKVLAGALIPLAVTILYFASQNALGDLWRWTIEFNYKVYAPMTRREDAGEHFLLVLLRIFKIDSWLVVLSLCGFCAYIFVSLRQKIARRNKEKESDQSAGDALWIAPLVYLLFSFINFQAGPDLIPLFPFIGIFAGLAVTQVASLLKNAWTAKLLISVMLILTFWRGIDFWRDSGPQLQEQIKDLEVVQDQLGLDDKILVHGATEVLVLLNKPNATPYVFLDYGKDSFMTAKNSGDFNQILADIDQQRPKIIILSRLKKFIHKAELRQWVEVHYDRIVVPGYDEAYVRRMESAGDSPAIPIP